MNAITERLCMTLYRIEPSPCDAVGRAHNWHLVVTDDGELPPLLPPGTAVCTVCGLTSRQEALMNEYLSAR